MDPQASILVVHRAVKSYGKRGVLRGVDLQLQSGEIYALLGRNGAGKTTLLRSICGRLALDEGHVRLAGKDPLEQAEVRRDLALVPQQIALYPQLTVRENFVVLGRLAGMKRSELPEAIARALDWSGLRDRADDRVDRLSGGMQRRVNLAAGALHRPAVLLLDEPTVGVDPQARDRLHGMLETLRDSGLAILITTHDMQEAEQLADRTGILARGRICAEGALDDLIRSHFGDTKGLTVRLADPPDGEREAVLRSAGLDRYGDGTIWSGAASAGFDELAGLARRFAEAGLSTEEVRLREPGLRDIYFRVTGREYEP